MKLMMIPLLCLLASCSLTPTQKKYTALGLSVLAIGMVAAHDDSENSPGTAGAIGPRPSCKTQPNGSCR